MPFNSNAINNESVIEVSQSIYLSEGLGSDLILSGRRYLKAGFLETNPANYDANAHQGGSAGSSTVSKKGSSVRYVRIT